MGMETWGLQVLSGGEFTVIEEVILREHWLFYIQIKGQLLVDSNVDNIDPSEKVTFIVSMFVRVVHFFKYKM